MIKEMNKPRKAFTIWRANHSYTVYGFIDLLASKYNYKISADTLYKKLNHPDRMKVSEVEIFSKAMHLSKKDSFNTFFSI